MTERPNQFDGEQRQTSDLAPENDNSEQRDGESQTQNVAQQSLERSTSVLGLDDSEKSPSGLEDESSEQDLVEHMKQMDSSGSVDMSAYAGEPNHDDNVDKYGKRSKLDDLRGDGT